MRSELKARTAVSHAALDQAISCLDLSQRQMFTTFLRTHHMAYSRLCDAVPPDHWVHAVLGGAVAALDADLSVIHAPPAPQGQDAPLLLHPLGVAYVVCGSHFGKHVLRRRWQRAGDPQVQAAGAYLGHDGLRAGWQRLIAGFDAQPPDAATRMQICDDADQTFQLFRNGLVHVQTWEKAYAPA